MAKKRSTNLASVLINLDNVAEQLSRDDVKMLVKTYYAHQENRKRLGNQIGAQWRERGKYLREVFEKHMLDIFPNYYFDTKDERELRAELRKDSKIGLTPEEAEKTAAFCATRHIPIPSEPHSILQEIELTFKQIEKRIQQHMDRKSRDTVVGQWIRSIYGIGPISACGLLCEIDIERAPHASNIWSFCGLNPNAVWAKGEKRPWNGDLKVLCWRLGMSFMRIHRSEKDTMYGRVYSVRKRHEIERDQRGENAKAAAIALETRNIKDVELKAIYSGGHLPLGRLDMRARRFAVKLFLSHLHHVMYVVKYGRKPAPPWMMDQADPRHTQYIPPPNWPMDSFPIADDVEDENWPTDLEYRTEYRFSSPE